MGSYIQRVILGGSQGMTGGIKIVSEANLGSFGEITATRTTNTFTPTTLKNIEQLWCPQGQDQGLALRFYSLERKRRRELVEEEGGSPEIRRRRSYVQKRRKEDG